jgi:hypothetical protein
MSTGIISFAAISPISYPIRRLFITNFKQL